MSELLDRIAHLPNVSAHEIHSLLLDMDDRSTVIMAASLLDDLLAVAIIHKFKRWPSNTQADELFTGYGPLSTLSAKASLAGLLGLMGPDMRHDMALVRKIRNNFAHTYTPLSFESKKIAAICKSLKLQTKLADDLEHHVGTGAKGRFIRSVLKISILLMFTSMLATEEQHLIEANKVQLQEAAKDGMRATYASAMERRRASS
jgi:DNA-binding MltR family transcriptional regulator